MIVFSSSGCDGKFSTFDSADLFSTAAVPDLNFWLIEIVPLPAALARVTVVVLEMVSEAATPFAGRLTWFCFNASFPF